MEKFEENCDILESEQLGRFMVARRDIARGQQILLEQPVVVGPYWDSDICCLNCYGRSCTVCRKCRKAPLCQNCPGHDLIECEFYRDSPVDKNFLFNHFHVITPVRCLLVAARDRKTFDEVMKMEAHMDARRGTEIWAMHEKYVVRPLLEGGAFGKFSHLDVGEDDLQRVCGIFDVNAFEIRGSWDGEGVSLKNNVIRGLYPKTALITHGCVTNTMISVDNNYNLRLYATVPIGKDDMMLYNYTRCLFGTPDRREHLLKGKYFICSCRRCQDPTELGTHLSSIRCTKNKQCDGLSSYHESNAKWECNKCGGVLESDYAQQVTADAKNDILNCTPTIENLEKLISKHSDKLNPSHSLVLEAKQLLAGELRRVCHSPAELCRSLRQTQASKLKICEEILLILRILEPGISRLTGIALYEYNTALWEISKMDYGESKIDERGLLKHLESIESGLKESISMLLLEHPSTPEGQLTRKAMQDLKIIRTELVEIRKTVVVNS
ncbi:SET domain-containing protein SmydA-8-like [Uranotaenia lowii]|uniref:SET domain-containing protein SmydA-8-like n=1 Tax=Uranotaenia lowii TaxID=190385 RepID=UPI00247A5E4D|nr:SET domain-containing protein SmydA-8-like [Uranotaenia lowii]